MKTNLIRVILTLGALAITSTTMNSDAVAQNPNELAGTSWKLVRLQAGDETTIVPGDGSKYTITFGANGRASVRVDCNRGGGSWKYKGPNQIQFGAMSITREKCGANSLYDRIVREGASIRNYSIKDGHLFLSLLEEGGTYELEPLRSNRNR